MNAVVSLVEHIVRGEMRALESCSHSDPSPFVREVFEHEDQMPWQESPQRQELRIWIPKRSLIRAGEVDWSEYQNEFQNRKQMTKRSKVMDVLIVGDSLIMQRSSMHEYYCHSEGAKPSPFENNESIEYSSRRGPMQNYDRLDFRSRTRPCQ